MLIIILSIGLFAQDMTVFPGTKMTVKPGTQLNLINGTDLILQDNFSTSPSFLQEGPVNFLGGGQANVEQYLTKDTWNMVSSPMNNATIDAYSWMYLYYFNETDNSWNSISQPLTLPLNAGQGYFVWPYTSDPNGSYPASPDSAVVKGNLNFQDLNLILSNTDSSPKSGWNLVGNPFSCSLNWNGDASWNLDNVGAAMYIKDPVSGNYVVWNYITGGTNANGGYIAATQAFWVRVADTTGVASAMTIPSSQRSHSDASFYKSSGPALSQQLLITIENDGKTDKTIIGFIEDATAGFDEQYDAIYLYGDGGAHSVYSKVMETKYALNHLPSVKDYPIVPLNFEANVSGNYTLSVDWIDSFSNDIPVYLEDIKTGFFQNLRESADYDFIAQAGGNPSRFNIHFTEPLDIENYNALAGVQIYASDKNIYVRFHEEMKGTITVFSLMGKQIAVREANEKLVVIPVNTNNNYLLVRVLSESGTKSQKVFIK